MKKNLPIALLLFCSSLSFAQGLSIANARKSAVAPSTHIRPNHETRSMTCANDTTLYTLLKEENLGTSTYYTTDMYNGVITEYSQTFLNTGTLTVNGISFFGNVTDFVNPAQTVTATVVLYNVNASNTPTTQITSATILLNTTFGQYTAMFTSPVTVTGNYAVALKNTSTTDTLTVFLNDAMTATYGESLGFLNAPAFGGWLAPSVAFGAGIESEGLIAPVLSYPIATNYTMSPAATTMCLGTVLTFTNTTTPTNILTNRMYNYGAFNAFWNSVPDSIYVWDMGDGSPLQWSTNAAYTYPAAGLDTVTLYTLGGLMSSCLDTKETYLNITANAVASFTQNTTASPLIAFTSTSTGAVTYAWDFGDGSPVDNTMNPSHTFPVGVWTVTLTVTSAGGCNTSITSQIVTVLATGISASSIGLFNIYPNPSSTGVFTIEMASNEANVQVYNTLGELVHSSVVSSSLDLSSLGAGIYTMKVNATDKNIVKQIVITK